MSWIRRCADNLKDALDPASGSGSSLRRLPRHSPNDYEHASSLGGGADTCDPHIRECYLPWNGLWDKGMA
eukprot:6056832-Pyramimonas_sp.AAC.1